MEYIEREEVYTLAKKICYAVDTNERVLLGRIILDLVDDLPAADVRPVVRGRWIRHYEQADTGEDIINYPCGWVCSECGRWESEDEPFCNCGAMMEES